MLRQRIFGRIPAEIRQKPVRILARVAQAGNAACADRYRRMTWLAPDTVHLNHSGPSHAAAEPARDRSSLNRKPTTHFNYYRGFRTMKRTFLRAARRASARRVTSVLGLLALAACSDDAATPLAPVAPTPAFARGGSGDNNGRILFTSYRDDPSSREIYSMNADGTDVTRLTISLGHDMSPAWSPDGKRVAFVSMRNDPNGEIYVMNADGTGVTRLTYSDGADRAPTWSKDGKRIAFQSMRDDPAGDIYVMNDDGSGVTRVTTYPGADFDPAWSPDGKQIAFASAREAGGQGTTDVYVLTLETMAVARVTSLGANVGHPSWAPGGKQIAFHTAYDPGDANLVTYDIVVLTLDGMQLRRITGGPGDGTEDLSPSWSPDGKQIAFTSVRDYNYEIYVMNADGSQRTRLTTSAVEDAMPAWNR
jgi:TolB protein